MSNPPDHGGDGSVYDGPSHNSVSELRRSLQDLQKDGIEGAPNVADGADHEAYSSNSTVVSEQEQEEMDESIFSLERILKGLVDRVEERDIPTRELGVAFRDLKVTVMSPEQGDNTLQHTLGSTFNPFGIVSKIQTMRHPETKDILTGFEGVVYPREMLLVLGRPGSGCSTLLKTLTNQRGEYQSVTGEVHYDAFTPAEIAAHYRGDVIYCPEDDIHFPTLTVRQTLDFAATTRAPHKRFLPTEEDIEEHARGNKRHSTYKEKVGGEKRVVKQESRGVFISRMSDLLSKVFGLKHVADTKVGDAAIRGVSGGEKKRVSIAEALATRARIGAWDNSTRGLDASTAVEYIRALRTATDLMSLSTIVSIYQAGESLYQYFDKVCVIYDGRMVYYGRAADAKQYFIDMGYKPKDRQTTADFLVAVTDPNGREEREGMSPPRTAEEMARYFANSPAGEKNRMEVVHFLENRAHLPPDHSSPPSSGANDLKRRSLLRGSSRRTPKDPYTLPTNPSHVMRTEKKKAYKHSARSEKAEHTRRGSPYIISIPMQARAVMKRRVQILLGDIMAQVIQLCSFIFQAIIMGTVFFNVPDSTSAYFSRGGVLFFALLFSALTAMAEIPALYAQRPIVSRHQRAAMYHPFIEALALTLVDVPITFFTTIIFSTVLYELVQLQQSAGQFFTFFIFVFVLSLTMKAVFRTLAAAVNQESTAQALGGILILALVLYTGYTIPQPSMIGALKWITYINPIRYGFEGLLVNEYHTLNGTCATLVPSGPGYEGVALENQACTTVGSLPGQDRVDGNRFALLSYNYSHSHLWRNFGIILAFGIFFMFLLLAFTERLSSGSAGGTVLKYARSAVRRRRRMANDSENVLTAAQSRVGSEKTGPASSANSSLPVADLKQNDLFSWQHLRYTVPIAHGDTRQLLDDVSGYVAPGKLTALMGESGAGKTTLLNVLAERVSMGIVTGDRFVNGQALPRDFQAQTGYCQQMDTHLPEATVREALLFSAKLRQPPSVSVAEKEAYVETCLKMCGLESYADAIVGTLGVEQRKRTTIAVELAAKPKLLLFLDEPTSGLDSQSSWAIMQFLRSLADSGQAILCTIHQPSGELFQVFDRLLLLRKGGQTVYFGDLGPSCNQLINYFESKGGRKCGPEENPAEWMLDVIGAGATASSKVDWREAWNNSEESRALQQELEGIHSEGRQRGAVKAVHSSDFATAWPYQFKTLLERAFISYWRNPTYLIAKLALNIASGLFIGFTFFKSKDSIQGTQDKLFAVFMATILAVPLSNQLQGVFIDFRNIYEIRERPSKMYSWTAWVTAHIIVELPYNILGSTVFFICWFWTVGFIHSRAGYTYLAYGIAFPLYYTTIAQAVAAMSPNAVISSILFSTLFSFVITFNGVLQPFNQLGWWKWMYRVSPFTYLIEGLVGQAVGRSEITCADKEFSVVNPPSGQSCQQYLGNFVTAVGGYVNNPDSTSQCQYCPSRTSDEFLINSFNIHYSHHWRNIGIVLGVTIFNIAAIFAFTYFFRIRSSFFRAWVKRRLARLTRSK